MSEAIGNVGIDVFNGGYTPIPDGPAASQFPS